MKIYLAGAASKEYEERCRIWRRTATKKLERAGFEVINPIKDYPINKEYSVEEIIEVVEKDLKHVVECDMVLAEVGTMPHEYVGTSMEIRVAYQNSIPVIVWSPLKDNFFLIYHSTVIFESLDASIEHCIMLKRAFEEWEDDWE